MKRVIGTSWCLLLAACSSTIDPQPASGPSPTTNSIAIESTGVPAGETARVFRDPVTGKLRAPTDQELARMQAEASAAPTENAKIILQADGTEMLIMQSNKKMDFMQACRQPDGSLVMSHQCDQPAGAEQ